MKKKIEYMRGLGIGILVTAIVFTIIDHAGTKKPENDPSDVHNTPAITSEIKNTPVPTKQAEAKTTQAPKPTNAPTAKPTATPSTKPTATPASKPTITPNVKPTITPSIRPTVAPGKEKTATIVVEKGMSSRNVCELIKEAGLIDDYTDLRRYLEETGLSVEINVGTYEISNTMTYEEIGFLLTGKEPINVVTE